MNNKCAIYVRTANIRNEGLYSYQNQLEQCKKYAKDKGYELYNIYQDIASGVALNRSALQELLNDASEGKFNTIIMTNKSRLVRDYGLLTLIQSFLEDNNISILTLE
jgi:DNA invertase Pin-like site-specific DNA recombinase